MTTRLRAAIVGSTGYGGVELIRLLLTHPNVEITSVISSSTAGVPIADGYPHLNQIVTDHLDGIDIPLIASKADVVFLATPHGVSIDLSPKLLDAGLKVIDLSGDFRLQDGSVYEQWYKHKPAAPDYLAKAVYGLCELFGNEVPGASFISNPGCYPTASILGLAPLAAKRWIDLKSIIIDAKSGVSGAGRGLSQTVHYAEINENFLAYKVNRHQHTPEIEQAVSRLADEEVTITFTTHLVPMTRGIMATIYVNLNQTRSEQEIHDLFRSYYEGRPFVRVRPLGKYPGTKEVAGSNYCDIGLSLDARTGRLTIVSVIDNMVKGAAGQAVQNLNIMMGWDEATGLAFTPVYP
ncbi:N-acetyl-gamma-glutamyl-phosphate reductase [Paenibacillus sp. UNCCL117]|uniref:N-acetyl-gamma-glutamyl-phosphate reductase n=1 Tax=unclassified Paenibacillus TaxID=185978 RepID=UPI00088CF80E|nr:MULTISPECIES: N-acetyl-gamma-glutamyl-phosphate reductase [unclassified Paenibacillus]SDE50573.1 N-acetyl-gamma-glutamyl-phosphate reductase [Paenibacillus sp. cl123]SFW67327.1 N-acetyl-gamma-glutamyl-phosphate reductase [Paenibacillus sp. UNCCL117]